MNTEYEFTQDYASKWGSNWAAWTEGFGLRPCNVLEIGSYEGGSALWWLDNVVTHPASRLTLIDPCHDSGRYGRLLRNLSRHPHIGKVKLLRERSVDGLSQIPRYSCDLIYIDGSHEGVDVLADAAVCLNKVKEGGILIFDDYRWREREGGPRKVMPGPAIDAFLAVASPWVELIHMDYQVAVRKISHVK